MHYHESLLCHVINSNNQKKIPKTSDFSYVDVFCFSVMYTSVHSQKGKLALWGFFKFFENSILDENVASWS